MTVNRYLWTLWSSAGRAGGLNTSPVLFCSRRQRTSNGIATTAAHLTTRPQGRILCLSTGRLNQPLCETSVVAETASFVDMSVEQNTRRRTGNVYFCTLHRFSADCARTRATRVIRWRVLVVRAAKVETERKRAGRPGDSRTNGKQCECVGVRCAFRMAGTREPFQSALADLNRSWPAALL